METVLTFSPFPFYVPSFSGDDAGLTSAGLAAAPANCAPRDVTMTSRLFHPAPGAAAEVPLGLELAPLGGAVVVTYAKRPLCDVCKRAVLPG